MNLNLQVICFFTGSFFVLPDVMAANEMPLNNANVQICSSCHGVKGISSNSLYPNLAGQDEKYLINQLKKFKSGDRINPIMNSVTKTLSDEEIITLAVFYSKQLPKSMPADAELIEKGKSKYSLCWSCHGENGEGPGSYPRVAGQHAEYSVQQLKKFKNGSRKNPVMEAISTELTDEDIEAVSAYMASLRTHTVKIGMGD